MANLDDIINTLNPGAVPDGTDRLFCSKANGLPASYTFSQIAAYISGVTLPTWLTDNALGAHVRLAQGTGIETFNGNIVAFNTIVHDSGFYALGGAFVIPNNVTRVQIAAGVRAITSIPKLSIIKNGDTDNRIVVAVGAQGYVNAVTPELVVTSGDTFQVYCENVGDSIYTGTETYFSIRTTEKLS